MNGNPLNDRNAEDPIAEISVEYAIREADFSIALGEIRTCDDSVDETMILDVIRIIHWMVGKSKLIGAAG